jgi:phytoene dehydrogenase-like protein
MSKETNVLILGAGPNGLTCGAYLARAGANVKVIEKNVESGGGLMTQELSGFKLNSHAIYMLLSELMPPYKDLELEKFGVKFVRPEVQNAFLYDDSSLILYSDPNRTLESIRSISPSDVDTFKNLYNNFKRASDEFIIPATYVAPVDPLEQINMLEHCGELGQWLNELAELTPREVIEGYGFKDERIEAALLYLATMFGLDPDGGGMGFLTPIYVYRLMQTSLVIGGTHQMASGLRRALERYGGQVITGAEVKEVLVKNGRATGVRLDDGTVLYGDVIVSTLNPTQNFKKLIKSSTLPDIVTESADAWEYDETSLFVVNWGIVGDPPHYDNRDPEVDKALNVVFGISSVADVISHFEKAATNQVPDGKTGHVSCPSIYDPLGSAKHLKQYGNCEVLRFECLAPYDINWTEHRTELARSAFNTWSKYASNLKNANIRVELPWTPYDIERHLPTMKRGAIKHGAYISIQMGYNRPNMECSSYKTPLESFYVAGASTHPGGMVILGAGYNAAKIVAEDTGLNIWWETPEFVKKAIENGYLPEN